MQVKTGVKRKKADTTTPGTNVLSMVENSDHPAKIPLRRESSNRTIKKPTRELPGEQEIVTVSSIIYLFIYLFSLICVVDKQL